MEDDLRRDDDENETMKQKGDTKVLVNTDTHASDGAEAGEDRDGHDEREE